MTNVIVKLAIFWNFESSISYAAYGRMVHLEKIEILEIEGETKANMIIKCK